MRRGLRQKTRFLNLNYLTGIIQCLALATIDWHPKGAFLDFIYSNKSWMNLIGFEKVPTKGAVTKFRKRMGTDFNRFLGDLIAYIPNLTNLKNISIACALFII